jgi:hypothetical protein
MSKERARAGGVPAGEAAPERPAATRGRSLGSSVLELYATAFVTGAAVMVVEILGTRIIGPVFGVSLFVWSALLAVTLASLACGYYSGGAMVDRRPSRRLFSLVVAAAGVLLGLAPLISYPVLRLAQHLGPRGGPLLSAALLFGPALAVLGMVGPIAVRLATNDIRATGHRVGGVYAKPDEVANLVFFASDSALEFKVPEDAKFENEACRTILRGFNGWEVLQRVPEGPVITDRWNPLARLQLPIAEEHFAAMNELLPAELWLH